MAKALVVISVLIVGMLVVAHGARELQQVVRSSTASYTPYAQATPTAPLSGGGGGGSSGNSGSAAAPDGAAGPSSGSDDSGSGSGNASNNAEGKAPPTLIRKDLGSGNSYLGG